MQQETVLWTLIVMDVTSARWTGSTLLRLLVRAKTPPLPLSLGQKHPEHNLEMKLQDRRAHRSSLHLGDYCQNALPANIPSKAGLSDSFKSRKAKALTLLFFHPREAFGKDVSPAFLRERSHHLFLWDAS